LSERTIKHLEFIQSNISRMNHNSVQMKGMAIAIVSALLAIFAGSNDGKSNNDLLVYIAIAQSILFWLLDSYYLQQERKFRGVYEDVAGLSDCSKRVDVREFEIPLHKYKGWQYCYFRSLFSATEWLFYLALVLIGLAVIVLFA
jgi:hypothetical protein